ncbi:putative membrane protein [Saccharothrix ecbatanensis]|jgi:putative membrane protein|uniref:Putative membrane protein n=1 Tax=Saccharothrix ecbatanensis TaxID=1105145 RepID=A0A7W9M407_9PSEU|nr:phage holin family protein [Saccharothrix ecbatanensis]MBB5806605.1 putative membrane protein [Saccharothrix ecbatanensis]
MGILVHVLLTAVAVWVATLIPGIDLESSASTPAKIGTLIGVALLFGLVNAVVKPLVKFFGCLFYLVTLGLIGLVVNALLFWLTGWLAGELGLPFDVSGFWPAFFGAIIVALTSWILNLVYDRITD